MLKCHKISGLWLPGKTEPCRFLKANWLHASLRFCFSFQKLIKSVWQHAGEEAGGYQRVLSKPPLSFIICCPAVERVQTERSANWYQTRNVRVLFVGPQDVFSTVMVVSSAVVLLQTGLSPGRWWWMSRRRRRPRRFQDKHCGKREPYVRQTERGRTRPWLK